MGTVLDFHKCIIIYFESARILHPCREAAVDLQWGNCSLPGGLSRRWEVKGRGGEVDQSWASGLMGVGMEQERKNRKGSASLSAN